MKCHVYMCSLHVCSVYKSRWVNLLISVYPRIHLHPLTRSRSQSKHTLVKKISKFIYIYCIERVCTPHPGRYYVQTDILFSNIDVDAVFLYAIILENRPNGSVEKKNTTFLYQALLQNLKHEQWTYNNYNLYFTTR